MYVLFNRCFNVINDPDLGMWRWGLLNSGSGKALQRLSIPKTINVKGFIRPFYMRRCYMIAKLYSLTYTYSSLFDFAIGISLGLEHDV